MKASGWNGPVVDRERGPDEHGRDRARAAGSRQPVVGGVEARLQHPQRDRRQREHLAAPGDRLVLEALERHDRVHEAPVERLCASYWRQRNQISLARFCPICAASRPRRSRRRSSDPRPGLAEARVVGGDREVADEVQHVAAADRVAGDHRDDRLGRPPDLDLQVE
jgi:hypothetical protein